MAPSTFHGGLTSVWQLACDPATAGDGPTADLAKEGVSVEVGISRVRRLRQPRRASNGTAVVDARTLAARAARSSIAIRMKPLIDAVMFLTMLVPSHTRAGCSGPAACSFIEVRKAIAQRRHT